MYAAPMVGLRVWTRGPRFSPAASGWRRDDGSAVPEARTGMASTPGPGEPTPTTAVPFAK